MDSFDLRCEGVTCNMGMQDLPDMYAQRVEMLGQSQMHILQLLCNSSIAIVTVPVG